MAQVLLLAASGLAREVLDAELLGLSIVGILDDDPRLIGTTLGGVDVLGPISDAVDRAEDLLVCMGAGAARRSVVERLHESGVSESRYATAIDDAVRIPPSVTVGVGTILLRGVVITSSVTVGRHVVVMPNSTLTHDVRLDDFATLAAGVSLGGGVRISDGSYLGMNSAVRQGVTVGSDATIGMGAMVLDNVPARETWMGVPARPRKEKI